MICKCIKFSVISAFVVVLAGMATAVPPESYDQFGNPEEPALRPIKWTLLGLKSLVLSTQGGLKEGVYESPAAMATDGAKGAVRGAGSLTSHVAHGILYSPLPEKSVKGAMSYEQAAMVVIEKETAKQEEARACCDEKCAKQEEDPGAIYRQPAPSTIYPTEEKALEGKAITLKETSVQKAQTKYLPLQTSYRGKTRSQGKGNLLKLAE